MLTEIGRFVNWIRRHNPVAYTCRPLHNPRQRPQGFQLNTTPHSSRLKPFGSGIVESPNCDPALEVG